MSWPADHTWPHSAVRTTTARTPTLSNWARVSIISRTVVSPSALRLEKLSRAIVPTLSSWLVLIVLMASGAEITAAAQGAPSALPSWGVWRRSARSQRPTQMDGCPIGPFRAGRRPKVMVRLRIRATPVVRCPPTQQLRLA